MKFSKINTFLVTLWMLCFLMQTLTAYAANIHEGHTPSGIPFSEIESQIDALVAEHLGQTTPGAAIVVVSDGEIIFSKGYGYADIEHEIPVDPETTVFGLASISKTFVWTAVMQLVEQGLLDLDADINIYLPETVSRQFAFEKPFTMRDLMNHAAGFEDIVLGYRTNEQAAGSLTLEEILILLQPAQIYEPGTASAYSNWGTNLAAYVVSQISSQSYEDFANKNIFIPTGMNTLIQPHWLNNQDFLQLKAIGYYDDNENGFGISTQVYSNLYASGSANGTAIDIANFIMALTPPQGEAGALFGNPNTHATLFSPSSLDPAIFPGTYHGFLQHSGTLPSFGHGGDLPGISTEFAVVPEERFGVVVLLNVTGEMDFRYGILDLLLGSSNSALQPTADNLPDAASVAGNYITMRRFESNLLEFGNFFVYPIYTITAIDENTIHLKMGSFATATYRQVEPYVFSIIETDTVGLGMDMLRFRVENGKFVQIHIGNGDDLSAMPTGRSVPSLIASAIITTSCALFFLLMPVVLLITFLIKRKKTINKTRFRLFSNGLLFSGTLLIANNLLCVGRLLSNPYQTIAGIAPHIWINYILGGLSILFFVSPLLYWHREKIKPQRKVLYVITASFTALLILILQNWNFFVIL